mmetsp:Transcript_20401/g.29228  ORF Transcript_20401/g.29228 Transcript_20401/m.29228 type:complete len:401 (+) Transcript_20401:35-1237(+)
MTTAAPAAVVGNRNTSIEFIVKPKEDLFLEGSLRRLPRVTKGEAYPCQMQKSQNFSCLFRHYAKHNGLRKEDLIFTFVDELLHDQTPESVHLMPQDEIWVEHRFSSDYFAETDEVDTNPSKDNDCLSPSTFCNQLRGLLTSGAHSDIVFVVGPGDDCEFEVVSPSSSSASSSSLVESIPAHRAVLAARSEYFTAMFREGGMSESVSEAGTAPTQIRIRSHSAAAFRRMLEFLYSNSIADLAACDARQVMALLQLANEYMLVALRELCARHCHRVLEVDNIGRFMRIGIESAPNGCPTLKAACARFIHERGASLSVDPSFRQEVENCPELGLLLCDMLMPKLNPGSTAQEGLNRGDKRRRVSTNNATTNAASNTAAADVEVLPSIYRANTIAQNNANVQDY